MTDNTVSKNQPSSEVVVKLAKEDIKLLSEAIAQAIHLKFKSPNFLFEVMYRKKYSEDAAEYVANNMQQAMKIEGKDAHLKYAIDRIGAGSVLEFGVFKGQSINWLAKWLPGRSIHGFDSFEGLPEDWTGYNVSAAHFDRKGVLPDVPDTVTLHKGWFDDTLPDFLKRDANPVAFIHIDCDLYVSTKSALSALSGRIKPGTIISFDEYHNYPGWRDQEYKAFQEFCEENKVRYKYLSYNNLAASVQIETIRENP